MSRYIDSTYGRKGLEFRALQTILSYQYQKYRGPDSLKYRCQFLDRQGVTPYHVFLARFAEHIDGPIALLAEYQFLSTYSAASIHVISEASGHQIYQMSIEEHAQRIAFLWIKRSK